MATAVQKITLSPSRDIPFNKLVLSQSNVRRVKSGVYRPVGNVRAVLAAHQMFGGQTSAHPLDQAAEQRQGFIVRFP